MKVKDLIKELEKHDPEAMVVVRAYEEGVNQATSVQLVKIAQSFTDKWYYGEFNIDRAGNTPAVFVSNGEAV
jgi:hypothetical protein